MASTPVTTRLIETPGNPSNILYNFIGKNSEAFTAGDPVALSSGQLIVAGTTNSVVGIAAKTITMASNNVGGANIQVPYIPVMEDQLFLMGTNGDFTGNSTDGGTYYKLTANTTNTVQVDQVSGVQTTTNRVVEIVEVDPFNEGGTGAGSGVRKVHVRFVRRPSWIDQ